MSFFRQDGTDVWVSSVVREEPKLKSHKRELREVSLCLEEGEGLDVLDVAFYSAAQAVLVAVTDRRILLRMRGGPLSVSETIALSEITSVETKRSKQMASLSFARSTGAQIRLSGLELDKCQEIVEGIRQASSEKAQPGRAGGRVSPARGCPAPNSQGASASRTSSARPAHLGTRSWSRGGQAG
jgi:hypothetical protein